MKLSQAEIEARLAEVRSSYINSLTGKADQIQQQWSSLGRQWHRETFQALYHLLHTLAGSAETFGLANITASARTLVELCRHHDKDTPFAAEEFANMTPDIERLLTQMRQAVTEPKNRR
ncbi:MAG: hypothetical protein GC149_17770 [Gammaproteobacteria bacterium]|nr:hypothetical protein [Gammaproteobacteria bacterium]